MPRTPPIDPAREAADLMSLASWYRAWADLASNDDEKRRRLDMAGGLELRARKLAKPD
jgi:hypothetical protein